MNRRMFAEIFHDTMEKPGVNSRFIYSSKIPNFNSFLRLSIRKNIATSYLLLNPHKCHACWKCIEQCHNHVINKVIFFMHKHIKIQNADACTGCMNCFNVCKYDALYKIVQNENL